MITLRRARLSDAAGIGRVHVATWRATYPGILPDDYLTHLSPTRQATQYGYAIRRGASVHVAVAGDQIIGFVTADIARRRQLGDGEIETLYLLDDFRDQGLGRGLLVAAAGDLRGLGCSTVYVWVLRDNPSRWFYQRLGAREVAEGHVAVAGARIVQSAYLWDPIDRLIDLSRVTPRT